MNDAPHPPPLHVDTMIMMMSLLVIAACSSQPDVDPGGIDPEPSGTTAAGAETGALPSATAVDTSSDPSGSPSADGDDDRPEVLDVGGEEPPASCAEATASSITLLDSGGSLYRFVPETLALESLGPLWCPGGFLALSLTSDRVGVLWAMMVDLDYNRLIYTVDPETLDCEWTPFYDRLDDFSAADCIAFVADEVGSDRETLYITGYGSRRDPDVTPRGLARIESLDTMEMSVVGMFPSHYWDDLGWNTHPILTGTGDARLLTMAGLRSELLTFAEIDPANASIRAEQSTEIPRGGPFALAQWAGQLYVFTNPLDDDLKHSEVYTYDPVTHESALVLPDLGIQVTGAAVSTCAPYEPEG